ncbi:jg8174 [Pararge aegeria aegeria]|uniref:Jg8174 protein n=1 Tax=Pararge aegeria aegeria TaxID=348720 RepID=A0A8S4SIG9_9NEOP|nr:jg8174 [Pararge aegeria aegeria]
MTEPITDKKETMEEIVNRKNLGEKKYHSETSLQKFGDENEEQDQDIAKDPGVLNTAVSRLASADDSLERRRTMSQPGPGAGSLITATAGRTRRRPPRNVMYAADLERTDSTERLPKFILSNSREEYYPPTPLAYENTPSPLSYNGNGNMYGNFRNGDIKSLNSYRMNTPIEMRGGTTPRKRSVATMDAQSIRSVETQAPPSTSPEENARLTVKYLTLMLSCMYAVLLVTLGFIVYLTDPFLRDLSTSPIFSLVLLGIGFLYHVYLVADITRYKKLAVKNQKIKGLHNKHLQDFFRKQEEEYGYSPGERTPDSAASQAFPSAALLPMNHDYCFSHGRHSGSFYLKLGAAGFALGHLIHSVLQITVQVGYLVDDDINNDECIDYPQFALDIASPLYCFIQLYFIFKYSNVHILKAQGLAHFGFMHMIGSSLCFWVYNIVRETVLALTIYAGILYGNRTVQEEPMERAYFGNALFIFCRPNRLDFC